MARPKTSDRFITIKILRPTREKLRRIAKHNKRKLANEVDYLVDQALAEKKAARGTQRSEPQTELPQPASV